MGCALDGFGAPCNIVDTMINMGAAAPGPPSMTRYNEASGGFEIYGFTENGFGWTPFGVGYLPGTTFTASAEDRVNQMMADSGLLAKGNIDYLKPVEWNGRGYQLTLTQQAVDWLKSGTQGSSPAFYMGSLGAALHVEDVGATSWTELWDFRSSMGLFGPGSMQVVVKRYGYRSFVDVDRWNPYQGLGPMLAHFLFEVLF